MSKHETQQLQYDSPMVLETFLSLHSFYIILNAQAQSATVPCRLSCGQCSDGRFVFHTCSVDMSLMCVACVSQSSFIQRRSHDYVCRMYFAKFFHSEMQSYTYASLNPPLRSGLVSRSLVARPSFAFQYPLAERPGQPLARSKTLK